MAVKEQADKDNIPFRYLQVNNSHSVVYVLLECFVCYYDMANIRGNQILACIRILFQLLAIDKSLIGNKELQITEFMFQYFIPSIFPHSQYNM